MDDSDSSFINKTAGVEINVLASRAESRATNLRLSLSVSLFLFSQSCSRLCLAPRQGNSDSWKVFNFLQRKAGQVAALDLGYKATSVAPGKKFVYLLQSDDFNPEDLKDAFVVYQGASWTMVSWMLTRTPTA